MLLPLPEMTAAQSVCRQKGIVAAFPGWYNKTPEKLKNLALKDAGTADREEKNLRTEKKRPGNGENPEETDRGTDVSLRGRRR